MNKPIKVYIKTQPLLSLLIFCILLAFLTACSTTRHHKRSLKKKKEKCADCPSFTMNDFKSDPIYACCKAF
jgi:hypothetical protein